MGEENAARHGTRIAGLRTWLATPAINACGLNWEEFCRQRAGISKSLADQMVRQLDEFGPAYFHLAAITRITPENFRLIAPSVTEQGVQHGSELVVFSAENATRLASAIEELRARGIPTQKFGACGRGRCAPCAPRSKGSGYGSAPEAKPQRQHRTGPEAARTN
jgi:hypothetical protein